MDELTENHLERLRASVLQRYSAGTVPAWVAKKTNLGMQPFNYINHEYQEKILSDTSRDAVIRKCAQVGLSEVSVRMALALVNIITPYTLIYTLPTSTFAVKFTKTRIDPIITSSPALSHAIHPQNNTTELKQFGDSFLYIGGAASSNAPISTPADHLIHDEVDFSDQEILSQYTSRVGHSKWKRSHKFSTPTLPGYGIDLAFQESRRHFLMCKCNHCAKWFVPDYYKHVRIPGYTGELEHVVKSMLPKLRWKEAHLTCPFCGKEPSLQPEHRQWVAENPEDNYVAVGYQVTPFDAPNVIKISDLVETSTKYSRSQDFVNFGLGLPAADTEATLTRDDFTAVFVRGDVVSGPAYVMGVDVGSVYHFVVAAVDAHDNMVVVHSEQVPMGNAKVRYRELKQQFRVSATVIDGNPHAETVMSLQDEDPNLFANVYVRSKAIVTHTVIDKEQEDEKGKQFQRQVNINRSRAFDGYMNYIREGHLQILDNDEKETIIVHHMSMKRVKTYDLDSGELVYSWQKTDGNDHYHHAFLFCWIAGKIRGVSRSLILLPVTKISKFKVKQHH